MPDSNAPQGNDPAKPPVPSPRPKPAAQNGNGEDTMPEMPEFPRAGARETPFGQGVSPTPSVFLTEIHELKDELYALNRITILQAAILAGCLTALVIILTKGTGNGAA